MNYKGHTEKTLSFRKKLQPERHASSEQVSATGV